jgi:hypothetical protein
MPWLSCCKGHSGAQRSVNFYWHCQTQTKQKVQSASVNASTPKGGEIQVRSLAGSIRVRDRALQADGKGANGAALIELVAEQDIVVESPTAGDTHHRPTFTTEAAAVNGVGQGGRMSCRAVTASWSSPPGARCWPLDSQPLG